MVYQLKFRPYRLPFRATVRTAHGPWTVREGAIVRLEDESGRVGFGEAAPIPRFGRETAEVDAQLLGRFGDQWDDRELPAIEHEFPTLAHALHAAIGADIGPPVHDYLPVAALLPAGRMALSQVARLAEAGFRTFKWKVGVHDREDEMALLDDLLGLLPSGAGLRLDANGGWDTRTAEKWLARCADRPIEYVEQPLAAGNSGLDDRMLGMAGDFPTPIALDESLVETTDLRRWLEFGWPGIYVIKPALLSDPAHDLQQLRKVSDRVVFSSALETGIGAHVGLRLAFSWGTLAKNPKPSMAPRALGFGVWPLFADSRFDGPGAAPFVRRTDLDGFNPEEIWNALN